MPDFDSHANLVFSTVATAPSPATTGTSLTVASGDGAKFPAVPFNVTISAAGATRAQVASGAEIARVTARAGDVLTITRATEGPNAARAVVVGDEVALTITAKDITDIEAACSPTGVVSPFAGDTAPSGWLLCDGSAVSRTTYADLYALLVTNKGSFTVTIASPGVFTTPGSHGLIVGDYVFFETTGALPTGLAVDTAYVVTAVPSGTTFRVSSSVSVVAGVSTPGADVITTGSQSGTHTLFRAPYCVPGVSFAATTFNVPDMRGNTIYGKDGATFDAMGEEAGSQTHVLQLAQLPVHDHSPTGNGLTGLTQPTFTGSAVTSGTESVGHTHSVTAAGTVSNHSHAGAATSPQARYLNTAAGGGGGLAITDIDSNTGSIASLTFSWTTGLTQPTFTGSAVTSGGVSATHTHSVTAAGTVQNHTHALQSVGGGSGHQNLPPYMVMNYIIRT